LFLSIPCCKKSPTTPDVPVLVLPTIEYFNANPESIKWGESSTLSWSVTNATTVTIDQGIGTVSAKDTKQVTPGETITYNLTAKNNDGQKSQSCTIEVIPQAIFELISYSYGYWGYFNNCLITGKVKNIGNATGYNVMITFQAYSSGNVIIDTAKGFPADLGNIPVGVKAEFEAIFFETYDWNKIAKVTYEISWLTKTGMKLKQTGVIPFK